MKFSPICSLLLFGLILSGCSKNKDERTGIDPLAKNKAAPEIEQSFAVKKTSSLSSTTAALKSNANSDGGLSVDKAQSEGFCCLRIW